MSDIKAAIFLQNKDLPVALKLSSDDTNTPLELADVAFFGGLNPGVWLRTQCDTRKKNFSLEECRGSVCRGTTTTDKSESGRHARAFRGEYGNYSLARAHFGEQPMERAALNFSTCGKTFPAWAVAARALNKNSTLEFPKNLLVLQGSKKIYLVDVTLNSLWNVIPWSSEKGIFQHASLSSDGRILLQNRADDALQMNFSDGTFVHFSKGIARTSLQGLNVLFGTQDVSTAQLNQTSFNGYSQGSTFVNLGGVWGPTGFVTWSDLTMALLTKHEPLPRPYPTSGELESALWSEESGIEKSYVLMRAGQTLELLASSDGGKSFVNTKTFSSPESGDTLKGTYLHEGFITKLNRTGALLVNAGGQRFSANAQLFSNTGVLTQNGFDLLSLSPHPSEKMCRATLFTPQKKMAGWIQRQVLSEVPCSTGTGRTSSGTSLVDISDGSIKISILE